MTYKYIQTLSVSTIDTAKMQPPVVAVDTHHDASFSIQFGLSLFQFSQFIQSIRIAETFVYPTKRLSLYITPTPCPARHFSSYSLTRVPNRLFYFSHQSPSVESHHRCPKLSPSSFGSCTSFTLAHALVFTSLPIPHPPSLP